MSPYGGGGGGWDGACLRFSKIWVPPSDGTPPLGEGQQSVGGAERKSHLPGAGNFFPHVFLCVGQSVSGWVPLGFHPPSPVGIGQVLCMPSKRGLPPFPFCPPPHPPLLRKALLRATHGYPPPPCRSPEGHGGPSLGDRPPGGGGRPSSLGWGTTRGGGTNPQSRVETLSGIGGSGSRPARGRVPTRCCGCPQRWPAPPKTPPCPSTTETRGRRGSGGGPDVRVRPRDVRGTASETRRK